MKDLIPHDRVDNSVEPDLGPFHGNFEQYATVFTWFTLVEFVLALLFPWFLAGIKHRHPDRISLKPGSTTWVLWLSFDFLGGVSMWSYYLLYKRLGARIALGGPDAVFLDRLRYQVASLVQCLAMLLLMAATHITP